MKKLVNFFLHLFGLRNPFVPEHPEDYFQVPINGKIHGIPSAKGMMAAAERMGIKITAVTTLEDGVAVDSNFSGRSYSFRYLDEKMARFSKTSIVAEEYRKELREKTAVKEYLHTLTLGRPL